MRRSRAPVARLARIAGVVGVALSTVSTLGWALGGRIFRNPNWRIGQLEVPRGWELVSSVQVAYPRILVVAESGTSRFTLGVERVTPGAQALDLATKTRVSLEKQGFADLKVLPEEGGNRVRLDASFDAGRRLLRQAFIVDGDFAYVLTVATVAERSESAFHDLDETERTFIITPPPPDGGAVTDGGALIDATVLFQDQRPATP